MNLGVGVWVRDTHPRETMTNSVKATGTLKYMKKLYKVMSFLFFRIKTLIWIK